MHHDNAASKPSSPQKLQEAGKGAAKFVGETAISAFAGSAVKQGAGEAMKKSSARASKVVNERAANAAKRRAAAGMDEARARLAKTQQQPATKGGSDGSLKGDARQSAKAIAKGAAAGAAKGAKTSSWEAAIAGAIVGAAKAAAQDKASRRNAKRIVGATAIFALMVAVLMASIIYVSFTGLLGGQQSSSADAAEAAGVKSEDIQAAIKDPNAQGVPWQLIAWLNTNGHEDTNKEKLAEELRRGVGGIDQFTLIRGAAVTKQGALVLGDTSSEKALQQMVEEAFVRALQRVGLDKPTAETAFRTAREWALATNIGCGVGTPANFVSTGEQKPGAATNTDSGGMSVPEFGSIGKEQVDNAVTIISVVKAYFPKPEDQKKAGIIALATAIREASLRNLNHGDEGDGVTNPDGSPTTSKGLFQQQNSWGTLQQRMDPVWATAKFLKAMTDKLPNWSELEPGIASFKVQGFDESEVGKQARFEKGAAQLLWKALEKNARKVEIPKDLEAAPGNTNTSTKPGSGTGVVCTEPGAGDVGMVVGDLALPVKPGYSITSFFGPRGCGSGGCSQHHGFDVGAPEGEPQYAVADGVVTIAGPVGPSNFSTGNSLQYEIAGGYRIWHQHFRDPVTFKVGDRVKKGQFIGYTGTTGYSFGAHMHFQVNGPDGKSVEPLEWLAKNGVKDPCRIWPPHPVDDSTAPPSCRA